MTFDPMNAEDRQRLRSICDSLLSELPTDWTPRSPVDTYRLGQSPTGVIYTVRQLIDALENAVQGQDGQS